METRYVPMEQQDLEQRLKHRVAIRNLNADEFIDKHASGTLRKNKRLDMCWRDQYLSERTAYEFGWEFECSPRSRVMIGDAYTEGDCAAITEAGWHIERYMNLSVFPDVYKAQYINVERLDGSRKEGIGIVVEQTSASWVPKNHVVYAIIAEYHKDRNAWGHAKNPF
jgi:hypothetical protein